MFLSHYITKANITSIPSNIAVVQAVCVAGRLGARNKGDIRGNGNGISSFNLKLKSLLYFDSEKFTHVSRRDILKIRSFLPPLPGEILVV